MSADRVFDPSAAFQYGEAVCPAKEEEVQDSLMARSRNVYSSRIIKAGALLPDTLTLFANWDASQSVTENLQRLQRENLFGKASRSRIKDILAIFRQRYLRDAANTKALARLVENRFPKPALDRIFYFYSAQSDQLLHDVVTKVVADLYERGKTEIHIQEIQAALTEWVREGKTTGGWSDYTIQRVAQGLMSTLRDFGILQGAVNKRLAPVYLPVKAFSYIAFYIHSRQPSGERLVQNEEWKLFLLSVAEVERLFMEAHQQRLLEYHAAGRIIRIAFPVESIEEYADVISERSA
jgi:hypothetical protein